MGEILYTKKVAITKKASDIVTITGFFVLLLPHSKGATDMAFFYFLLSEYAATNAKENKPINNVAISVIETSP